MGETHTKPRRSLHVFGALERGGAETWFLQALARRGDSHWDADICLLAGREGACVAEARRLGLRIIHCPYRPAPTFPSRFLKLLRRERYDAVHAHVLLFGGVIAAVAAQAATPLRVAHAHNSSDGCRDGAARCLYRAAMRRLIDKQANLVVACSPEAAGAFDCRRIKILPYGIDLRPFETDVRSFKARLGIPESARVIGAAGRLVEQKNYRFLLDAFAAASGPELHLVIAGDGILRSEIERGIAQRGLSRRVHLLGLRDDVQALMLGLFDAFAMPSLHEGLPVALLEAQAAGLPCLVSSAVSPHAVVLPRLVERLPLQASAWPAKLGEAARRARVKPAQACAQMRMAGFDAVESWARLAALYDAALEPAEKAQAA
jgi:glycosyltransferase involved in cell wall biosynthesis